MRAKAPRILLADDSPDEQLLTKRSLTKILPDGGAIRVVRSGNEAIAYMIGEGKFSDRGMYPFPSLIITDLNMKDGDGFDVLDFLRANPGWSVVPRIVLSSSDDDDDIRTAFFLGASAYHVKCSPARLDQQMRDLLEYWASSKVPPVDETGKIRKSKNRGELANRFPQPDAGKVMTRPIFHYGLMDNQLEAGLVRHFCRRWRLHHRTRFWRR